jgi:hypothetical protein
MSRSKVSTGGRGKRCRACNVQYAVSLAATVRMASSLSSVVVRPWSEGMVMVV